MNLAKMTRPDTHAGGGSSNDTPDWPMEALTDDVIDIFTAGSDQPRSLTSKSPGLLAAENKHSTGSHAPIALTQATERTRQLEAIATAPDTEATESCASLMSAVLDASTLPIESGALKCELQKREAQIIQLLLPGGRRQVYRQYGAPNPAGMDALVLRLSDLMKKPLESMSHGEMQLHLKNIQAHFQSLKCAYPPFIPDAPYWTNHQQALLNPATLAPAENRNELVRRAVGLEAIYGIKTANEAGIELFRLANYQDPPENTAQSRAIQDIAIASFRGALGDTACKHWSQVLARPLDDRKNASTSAQAQKPGAPLSSEAEFEFALLPRAALPKQWLNKILNANSYFQHTALGKTLGKLTEKETGRLIASLEAMGHLALTQPERFHDKMLQDPMLSSLRSELHQHYKNYAKTGNLAGADETSSLQNAWVKVDDEDEEWRPVFNQTCRSLHAIALEANYEAWPKSALAGRLFEVAHAWNYFWPLEPICNLRDMHAPSGLKIDYSAYEPAFRVLETSIILRALGEDQLQRMAQIFELPADGKGK